MSAPAEHAVSEVATSTYDEYVAWYLERDRRKRGSEEAIPATSDARRELMEAKHEGKLRPWFPDAAWSVVRIESPQALSHLMMLANCWTKAEGLVLGGAPRLLGYGARHANETGYFENAKEGRETHHAYYCKMKAREWTPATFDRFVLCTLSDDERRSVEHMRPQVRYYLHDGVGRGLPYLTLVDRGLVAFEPIEAFLATEV